MQQVRGASRRKCKPGEEVCIVSASTVYRLLRTEGLLKRQETQVMAADEYHKLKPRTRVKTVTGELR